MPYYDVIEFVHTTLFARIENGRYVAVLYPASDVLHDEGSHYWELASNAVPVYSSDRPVRGRETIMLKQPFFSAHILDDLGRASFMTKSEAAA